jgi:hypothetical protein
MREGAPLLEGAPLGMRRRDEGLGKGVRYWDHTKGEGKAWDPCLNKVKSHFTIKNVTFIGERKRRAYLSWRAFPLVKIQPKLRRGGHTKVRI